MKKILGVILLALVLTLAMAVPAMADEVTVDSYVCGCNPVMACGVVDPSGGSIRFGEVTPGAPIASGVAITVENLSTNDGVGNTSCPNCPIPNITATASVTKLGGAAAYDANLYCNTGLMTEIDGKSITVAAGVTGTLAPNVCFDVPDPLPAGTYDGKITITCAW